MKESNFEYSPELYVLQVNWQQRLAKEKPFFEGIIKANNVKNILDIGFLQINERYFELFDNYQSEKTFRGRFPLKGLQIRDLNVQFQSHPPLINTSNILHI